MLHLFIPPVSYAWVSTPAKHYVFVVGLCLDVLVVSPLLEFKQTCLSLSFILPQLYCKSFMSPKIFSFFYHVPAFQNVFFFSQAQSDNPRCKPQQIPWNTPETPSSSRDLTPVPIMKKYVQETGDCRRSHGSFILINLGQKLAARASRHSSRLPEVDPIFFLNRH